MQMKHAVVPLLALCVSAVPALAQTVDQHQMRKPGQTPALTVIVGPTYDFGSCPVSLRANQAAGGNSLEVDNAKPKGIAQGLRLLVVEPKSKQVVSASVTVRGLADKGRMVQTLSTDSETSDASRTLEAKFAAGAGNEGSAFIWVPGLTAVQAIDLDSVTYSDGTTWKMAESSVCRIVPDPLMLVNNR
jgi:hypothetical protein